MAKPVRDVGASVRARLLNLAREKNQAMDLVLTRYAIERLLYRLSISKHADRFILKGAVLVTTWFETSRIDQHGTSTCWASATQRPRRCSPYSERSRKSLLTTA